MSLAGSIFGAAIGAIFGGPLGAIIGGGLGAFLPGSKWNGSSQNQKEAAVFHLSCQLFRCLGKFAKCDGRVSEEEAEVVRESLHQIYPENLEKRRELVQFFNAGRDSSASFANLMDDFARQCAECKVTPLFVEGVMSLFCHIAAIEGSVSAKELKNLQYTATKLGQPAQKIFAEFNNMRQQQNRYSGQQNKPTANTENSLAECYKLLDISPSATDAEIKKAYRKKAADFHPDKIQGAGLPEEFTTFAKEQFQKISNAYETIRKARNMN